MAIKGIGQIDADEFRFQLDGLATAEQLDKLITLTKAYTTKGMSDADISKLNKSLGQMTDNTEEYVETVKESIKSEEKRQKATDRAEYSLRELSGFTDITAGRFGYLTKNLGVAGIAVGSLVGSVMALATDTAQGLQLGVGGQIMDFAIAAKTAGISTGAFTTALKETGGGFAMLGSSATDGSKQFGALVQSVRSATSSVGNLGLSNDELAKFTAQQVKLAVQQGFKGRAATQIVEKNSKAFAESIADMSNATGKAVTELAAAAMKLGSDPLIASFVASSKFGGEQVSKAINQFAVNLRGIFGEFGEVLSADALKSAMAGLPFAMTSSGKNMLIASSSLYNEFEKQAKIVRDGGQLTQKNADDMRRIALAEVEARGDQIRTMAMLDGPAGESARQLLKMAEEARFYNSDAGKKRRKEDEAAAAFVTATNQFSANLQALAVPFMNLINGVNWTFLIDILSGLAKAVQLILTPLTWLGDLLGKSGIGNAIGVIAGVVSALYLMKAAWKTGTDAFSFLKSKVNIATTALDKFAIAASERAVMKTSGPIKGDTLRRRSDAMWGLSGVGGKGRMIGEHAGATIGGTLSDSLKNFKGVIGPATAAIAGLGLASIGSSLLEEDANSVMGQVLNVGGEVIGLLSIFGANLSSLFSGLKWVAVFLGGAIKGALVALATALGLPVAAVVGIIAALVAVSAAVWYWWDDIKEIPGKLKTWFVDIFKNIGTWFSELWDDLGNLISNSWFGKALGMSKETDNNVESKSLPTESNKSIAATTSTPKSLPTEFNRSITSSTDSSRSAYPVEPQTSSATVDIMKTQTAAIDQNNLKKSESDALLRQNNKLLEMVADNSTAQLGVSSRSANAAVDTARFTRQTALNQA